MKDFNPVFHNSMLQTWLGKKADDWSEYTKMDAKRDEWEDSLSGEMKAIAEQHVQEFLNEVAYGSPTEDAGEIVRQYTSECLREARMPQGSTWLAQIIKNECNEIVDDLRTEAQLEAENNVPGGRRGDDRYDKVYALSLSEAINKYLASDFVDDKLAFFARDPVDALMEYHGERLKEEAVESAENAADHEEMRRTHGPGMI